MTITIALISKVILMMHDGNDENAVNYNYYKYCVFSKALPKRPFGISERKKK